MTVDQNLILNCQQANTSNSVTTTSFANLKRKSSSQSLLLSIVITSGFPDVSTHVHSFHERQGATFRVSQARYTCTRRVASLSRVDQGKTVAFCAPSTEIAWEQPGLWFLQGVRELQWNNDTLVKNYMADMHKRPLLMSSSRHWRTVNEKITSSTILRNVCFFGGRWESCVSQLVDAYQQVSWVLGAREEAWCLHWSHVQLTSRTNVKTSRTWSRDGREILNDSWMHQSRCACLCLFAGQINNISCHRTAFLYSLGVEISVRFIPFCSRKKTAMQFPDQLCLNRCSEKSC